jgi:hypothetical protein
MALFRAAPPSRPCHVKFFEGFGRRMPHDSWRNHHVMNTLSSLKVVLQSRAARFPRGRHCAGEGPAARCLGRPKGRDLTVETDNSIQDPLSA